MFVVLHIYRRTYSDKAFQSIVSKKYVQECLNFLKNKPKIPVGLEQLLVGNIILKSRSYTLKFFKKLD